jgi:hypothetical protein
VKARVYVDAFTYLSLVYLLLSRDPFIASTFTLMAVLTSIVNALFLKGDDKINKFIGVELILLPIVCLIPQGEKNIGLFPLIISCASSFVVFFIHIGINNVFKEKEALLASEVAMQKEIDLLRKEVAIQKEGFIRHQFNNAVAALGWKIYKLTDREDIHGLVVDWARKTWPVLGSSYQEDMLSTVIDNVKKEYRMTDVDFVDGGTEYEDVKIKTDVFLLAQFFVVAIDNAIDAYREKSLRPIIFIEFDKEKSILSIIDEAGGFNVNNIKNGFSTKNKKMEGTGGVGLFTLLKLGELCKIKVEPFSEIGNGTRISYHLENIIVGGQHGLKPELAGKQAIC